MSNSSYPDERLLSSLRSQINQKDQIIKEQQDKIQCLQDALSANQETALKLKSTISDKNQRSLALHSQNQTLQTNCEHLESQIKMKKKAQDLAGGELQKKKKDFYNAQNEHVYLQEQIQNLKSEVKSSKEKESTLISKVTDLTNQKEQLVD